MDGDQSVTDLDLLLLSSYWGQNVGAGEGLPGDFDRNQECDAQDLLMFIGHLR